MENIIASLPSFFTTEVSLLNVLTWLLFGLAVGVIATLFDPRPKAHNLFSATLLGILGALTGGFLANILFGIDGVTGFNIVSFLVAVGGSLLLLFIRRAFLKDERYIKTTVEHKE